MWMGPLFATIPCCSYTAAFGSESRAVAFHGYTQREPLRRPREQGLREAVTMRNVYPFFELIGLGA